MSNVEFEGEKIGFTSREILGEPVVPQTAKTLIKYGIVKNSNQARLIMLALIVVCIATTIYIMSKRPSSNAQSVPPSNYVPPNQAVR